MHGHRGVGHRHVHEWSGFEPTESHHEHERDSSLPGRTVTGGRP